MSKLDHSGNPISRESIERPNYFKPDFSKYWAIIKLSATFD
jgi:hypothetical protein